MSKKWSLAVILPWNWTLIFKQYPIKDCEYGHQLCHVFLGSPLSYFFWESDEPNNINGAEDCMHMWQDQGRWNDHICDNTGQETLCEVIFNCY